MSKVKFQDNSKAGTCPECDGDMLVKTNRHTGHQFLGCANYPECRHTDQIPEAMKLRALGAATLFEIDEEEGHE